ncbi:hypothetical protein BH11CYA1_BH11CYA1_09530 [soil metagenome]
MYLAIVETMIQKNYGFVRRSSFVATLVCGLVFAAALPLAIAKAPTRQEVKIAKQSSSQLESSRLVERARYCNKILESEEAIELANKALKLDSKNQWALLARAEAQRAIGNLEQAVSDYKLVSVSADSAAHSVAYRSMGEIYFDLKRFDESVESINRLEKEHHSLTDGMHECRAKSYMAQGKYVLAAADLTTAIESVPNNTRLYVTRARAYSGARQWEKALADYNKLIARVTPSITPTNAHSWCGEKRKITKKRLAEKPKEDVLTSISPTISFVIASCGFLLQSCFCWPTASSS